MNTIVCAPTDKRICWSKILWDKCIAAVKKLQKRIVKAQKEGRYNKVKSLQWLITHSFYAKLLAVKRVTSNKGKNTPGVDNIIWKSNKDKEQAVKLLNRRGYKAQPLRRVYIPKKNSKKKRPLGIPVMKDRAMQALYLLALDPVAETICDNNAYGFRIGRSTADAIEELFIILSQRKSAKWVLEGDIKGCFDNISHEWIMNNIPMDKMILEKWLKAGIIFDNEYYDTKAGTPQGGIISACLCNLALNGIEKILLSKFKVRQVNWERYHPKVRIVKYADDFVITGHSKELLENEVMLIIRQFLKERGLELSPEKTLITHIDDGFDFLGKNVRKYGDKLLTKPSKSNIKAFLTGIRSVIDKNKTMRQEDLIRILNPKIQGWANYHRHKVSKKAFGYVDNQIFLKIWQWCCRRHPKKGKKWIKKRYFHSIDTRSWVFGAKTEKSLVKLKRASDTKILRHIKIRKEANPYDIEWKAYFEEREGYKLFESMNGRDILIRMWKRQKGLCPICGEKVTDKGSWRMHKDNKTNKKHIVHDKCHSQLHGYIQNPFELAFS
ncbi:UNVERIFIED_CONTAM: RNA-directed DNA polymerase [Acetivibrio alkalicellulosi]